MNLLIKLDRSPGLRIHLAVQFTSHIVMIATKKRLVKTTAEITEIIEVKRIVKLKAMAILRN